MSRREEVEHLLARSREFMLTAEFQIERGLYGLAAFSLEQGLQLELRARLLASGVDFPRTHSIRKLLEMLASMDIKGAAIQKLLDKYLIELGSLEDAYITSRYISREFTKQEIERLRQVVVEVTRHVGTDFGSDA